VGLSPNFFIMYMLENQNLSDGSAKQYLAHWLLAESQYLKYELQSKTKENIDVEKQECIQNISELITPITFLVHLSLLLMAIICFISIFRYRKGEMKQQAMIGV
jgi:hypothetical protein